MITTKFIWIREVRWVVYYVGSQLVAMTTEAIKE